MIIWYLPPIKGTRKLHWPSIDFFGWRKKHIKWAIPVLGLSQSDRTRIMMSFQICGVSFSFGMVKKYPSKITAWCLVYWKNFVSSVLQTCLVKTHNICWFGGKCSPRPLMRTSSYHSGLDTPQLPKHNPQSSPLKSYWNPKGKNRLPAAPQPSIFRCELLNFQGFFNS